MSEPQAQSSPFAGTFDAMSQNATTKTVRRVASTQGSIVGWVSASARRPS